MIQMYSDSPKQTPDIDFIVILKWKLSVAVFHCQGHLVPFGVSEMPAALTKCSPNENGSVWQTLRNQEPIIKVKLG